MWFFGKDKDKKKSAKDADKPSAAAPAANPGRTEAQRKLLEQMRGLRAEIGEENLQKLANKLRLEDLKKQVRADIDGDEKKRNRLLDEIRFTMQQETPKDDTRK